jgi:hypothetical protein
MPAELGQIAHDAFRVARNRSLDRANHIREWDTLPHVEQIAWTQAAAAVEDAVLRPTAIRSSEEDWQTTVHILTKIVQAGRSQGVPDEEIRAAMIRRTSEEDVKRFGW